MRKMNKMGITPLLATFLLIIFAMSLGSVVMSFGKDYMASAEPISEDEPLDVCETNIDLGQLKNLQILHINNIISTEEYLEMEKGVK